MPKNKFQEVIFTIIMVFVMVYAMICYNIVLNTGTMTNETFLLAFHELTFMGPIAFILDFFIIGEIKGEEARYLLNAAYTGQLCAATIHAPSAPKALDKLIDYSLIDSKYSKDELLRMMDCFKTIIFMKNYKVCQVYAVKGYNRDKGELEYEAIWENGGFVNGYDKDNAGEIKY